MMTPYLMLLVLLTTFLQLSEGSKTCSERYESRLINFNPPELADPSSQGYSYVTVDTKLLVAHVAGQIAVNKKGEVVGKTLGEQLEQVLTNLKIVMDSVGADVHDITRFNIYIVNYNPDTDFEVLVPFAKRLGSPVGTLISVPQLAFRELLVEIDIDLVIPEYVIGKLRCRSE